MIRYVLLLIAYIPFFLLAMLVAPFLPLFAELRNGPIDNNNGYGVEPRLPKWLSWFDTSYDNSLWGDHGWRTKHCPKHWQSYLGMVLWLWRNPACGFAWSVLAHPVKASDRFALTSSGCGLDLDKSRLQQGWFRILSSAGAFQFRWVREFGSWQLNFECGWLLDVYLKSDTALVNHPRATFMCQPGIKRLLR